MSTTDTTISDLSRLAGTWTLDSQKSKISFRTKALWVLPVRGTAHALGGDAQIDASGNVNGTVVIDAASFDTNNKKRDDHLRSDDFLEVIKYPTIVFTVNGGRPAAAGGFDITGVLTIHGHSPPITLQAEVSGTGSSATMSGEVEIDRSLWGMSWTKIGARLKNQIAIRAHFDRA